MADIPRALVKDLLSTGYFYDDLRQYDPSKDIDLPTYSRNLAVPYLLRVSESFVESGQPHRSKIFSDAAECLSNAPDDGLAASIFDLKKISASHIDANEKLLYQSDQLDKSQLLSCRQQSESGQLLIKLLVSIIRAFKLTEVTVKRDKASRIHEFSNELIEGDSRFSAVTRA